MQEKRIFWQVHSLGEVIVVTGVTTLAACAAGAAALFALLGAAGIGDHTGTVLRAVVASGSPRCAT